MSKKLIKITYSAGVLTELRMDHRLGREIGDSENE